MDRRPQLLLPLWIGVFLAVMWPAATRPLWYDELVTHHIAMSPSWERFVDSLLSVDLQPPLNFLLVRVSVWLFGDSALSVRLPSLLAFLIASLIVFYLARRRWRGVFGILAISVFWCLWLVSFAVEGRPYALMLALFACAFYCWTYAIEQAEWSRWHGGLALSLGGLFLSHCFGPVCGAAIGVGELVRTARTRRMDGRVWIAILAPLAVLPVYIPLLRNSSTIRFPEIFQVNGLTLPRFYLLLVAPVLPGVALAAAYRWLVKPGPLRRWREIGAAHELGFCIAALCGPALIAVYCAWSEVAFFSRYGIGAMLGAELLIVALLAKWVPDRRAALALAALLLGIFVWGRGFTGQMTARFTNATAGYRAIRTDLPFVTANGLTFLEMDDRESDAFTRRLVYLTDNEAALRYIHSNMFEGLVKVQRVFTIRGSVRPYERFVRENRKFVVFARPEDHENWLLSKLKDDGARIELLSEEKATGYLDHRVYGVEFKR